MENESSLERIIPDQMSSGDDFDQDSLKLHRERYDFAIRYGLPGRILDIACGSGYGSFQMAGNEKFLNSMVTGVDISADAISYARSRYVHPCLEFICSDAMAFTAENTFDMIVSLETIEHVRNPTGFIEHLYSQLNRNGVLVISAPVTLSTDGNPYHLTDFTPAGFKKLFNPKRFSIEASLVQEQPFSINTLFGNENKRLENTRKHLGQYYIQHPKMFFKRIWSLLTDGFKNKYLTLALRKI